MPAQEISLSARGARSAKRFEYRRLGAIGMICAPALYAASLFFSRSPDQPNPHQFFASFFGALYICGAISSAMVMRKMRVTGYGAGAAVLFAIQMIGLFLALMFDVLEYAAPEIKQTTVFFVTDMAYPFSHLLMNVVGVAVIKAGVWRGWRRVPAFLIGAALPAFFTAAAIFGWENSSFVFISLVTAGFFLLGLAVKTTKSKVEA